MSNATEEGYLSEAFTLLRWNIWICFLASMGLNISLLIAVRSEKFTHNKLGVCNDILQLFGVTNLLMTICYTFFQPVSEARRSVKGTVSALEQISDAAVLFTGPKYIYILFIGLVPTFSTIVYNIFFSIFAAVFILNAYTSLIFIGVKYILFMRSAEMSRKQLSVITIFIGFWSSFIGIVVFLVFNKAENLRISESQIARNSVKKLADFELGFIVVKWNFKYYLMLALIPILIGFIMITILAKTAERRLKITPSNKISIDYKDAKSIQSAFFNINIQIAVLLTIPLLIYTFCLYFGFNAGTFSVIVLLGCVYFPVTSTLSIFLLITAYRKRLCFEMLNFLHVFDIQGPEGTSARTTSLHVSI